MAFDRLHMQHFPPQMDAAAAAAISLTSAPHHVTPTLPSMLFYPTPHYAMNLALAHNVNSQLALSKNSSIADLRLKAKKHSATLGF